MGPLTEEEDFLPKDHPISVNTKILSERFAGGGSTALYIVIHFGVLDIDKKGTSMWKSEEIGSAILDPDFDVSSVDAQQSLLDLCADLRNKEFVLNKEVECWIEGFKVYAEGLNYFFPIQEPGTFKTVLNKWATES